MRMKWMVGAMTLISRSLMSQSLDTLILLDQRIIAKVKEVSPNFVTYVLPGRDVVYSMDKTKLIKICYADRTIEQNPVTKIPGIAYPEDWRNVLISKKPEDIQGLYKLDDVFIMGSLLTNQGKNSLKIIAAMMGGNVVYPTGTDQIANTGYTTSSVRLNGHTSGYVTQPYTSVYTYTTAEVYTSKLIDSLALKKLLAPQPVLTWVTHAKLKGLYKYRIAYRETRPIGFST